MHYVITYLDKYMHTEGVFLRAKIEFIIAVIILAGLFQISDGLQTVGVSILRGLTDVRRPVLYAFISYICINLPLGYYLSFVCGLGERGIWIGFIVGLSIAALLYHVRCHRQINKLEKQSSTSI